MFLGQAGTEAVGELPQVHCGRRAVPTHALELGQRLNEKEGAPDTVNNPIFPAVNRHTGTCVFEGTDLAFSP